jgi:hypothetical protein
MSREGVQVEAFAVLALSFSAWPGEPLDVSNGVRLEQHRRRVDGRVRPGRADDAAGLLVRPDMPNIRPGLSRLWVVQLPEGLDRQTL